MRKKLEVKEAHATDNGIKFYSERHKGYMAISIVDELGNIQTKWTTKKKYKKEEDKHIKIANIKQLLIGVLWAIVWCIIWDISYKCLMHRENIIIIRFYLIETIGVILGEFFIVHCIGREKRKDRYKFQGAEHMVLNAYKKLKRVPSLEEIRSYSRYDKSCGTNFTTQIVMNFSLIYLCTFIQNQFYMIIGMWISNILILILLQCGVLNFLQKYTTEEPTDKELSVAIEGLNVWLKNEKN